jgi:hypothetical protein
MDASKMVVGFRTPGIEDWKRYLQANPIQCPNHYKKCLGTLEVTQAVQWVAVLTCPVCNWAETEYPDGNLWTKVMKQ